MCYIYSYSISMFTNTQEPIQIEQDISKHLLYSIILLAVLLNLLGLKFIVKNRIKYPD